MELLEKLSYCIEIGKIDIKSPFPPQMKGEMGAEELTLKAIEEGFDPTIIMSRGMISAMEKVGRKFSEKKIFIPQMMMSAKAMSQAMKHLKPFFNDGSVKRKGTFVIGTVQGDLHDIGKNLVAMMIEGNGWEVINLGVDVSIDTFLSKVNEYPNCKLGLSALLTTTMAEMGKIVSEVKKNHPETSVYIGGAPVNQDFCYEIGADFYAPDPQSAIDALEKELVK
jgi:5-methyltetrahydrofolate--homocysteine methyltransferase